MWGREKIMEERKRRDEMIGAGMQNIMGGLSKKKQNDSSKPLSRIEWLVQNNIIQIQSDNPQEDEAAIIIPSWIKTNARFWVENKITDADFVIGIEWLINNGIIRV